MNQLGIFAKYWAPGEAKTRLGAAIGYDEAGRIAKAFIDCLARRFHATADRRVLAVTPPDSIDEFQSQVARTDWICEPQSSGDLGARMGHFFSKAVAAGADRTVLLGSDSPTLPLEYVERAFEMLASSPVVLGPTIDGGYYLVGTAREIPPIFDGIDWSTESVFEQTVQRLRLADLQFGCLPEWYDVDEAQDLDRLRRDLQSLAEAGERDPNLKTLKLEIEAAFSHLDVKPLRPTPGVRASEN